MARSVTELNEDLVTGYAGQGEPERERERMNDREIAAWLEVKIENAMGKADSDISENRQRNLDYYTGKPYGDERDGYSKVITMETFEAVEWALPSLIRIFTASKFAQFKPNNASDQDAADQETDVVNDFICNETDLFEWCHSWLKDTLIYPNGYLKVSIDETRDMRTVYHEGLTAQQVQVLEQDENLFNGDVEEVGTFTMLVQTPQGSMPQEVPLYNVKARYLEPKNQIMIEAVPPEEVLVDNDLRHIDLDKAEFVCHHREVTRSDMIAMGFDYDTVWSLPISRELKFSTERERRADFHDEDPHADQGDIGAMEKIDLFECYAHLDADDDGYAEYCRFLLAGRDTLLEWSEWDYQPLIALSCFPQPHRHTGMSMADTTIENQRVNSVLKRQTLDNMYRVNRPRQIAGRGVNIEQLMNYAPHGVVEADDVSQVVPEQIPIMVQHIMPFMEYMRDELERRTGVSRHMAGLDAETLAKSTMGAYLESLGQATQRIEMLARNFAETGFKKVALKVHHLLRTRQNAPMTTELRGDWVEIDPRQWSPRHRMKVRVGVGTGSIQEKLAASMQIMQVQAEARNYGLANEKGAYKALEDFTDALGKTATEQYFVDPESPEYAQWAQQQEQQRQEALQVQMAPQQLAQQALQVEHMKNEGKTQVEMIKAQSDQAQAMIKAGQEEENRFLKAVEIELEYDVDVAGLGIKADQVNKMGVSNAGQ